MRSSQLCIHSKLDELASTIALYRSGKQDEARKLVLSDAGLRTMNQIRSVIAGMESEETRLEASARCRVPQEHGPDHDLYLSHDVCWLRLA